MGGLVVQVACALVPHRTPVHALTRLERRALCLAGLDLLLTVVEVPANNINECARLFSRLVWRATSAEDARS